MAVDIAAAIKAGVAFVNGPRLAVGASFMCGFLAWNEWAGRYPAPYSYYLAGVALFGSMLLWDAGTPTTNWWRAKQRRRVARREAWKKLTSDERARLLDCRAAGYTRFSVGTEEASLMNFSSSPLVESVGTYDPRGGFNHGFNRRYEFAFTDFGLQTVDAELARIKSEDEAMSSDSSVEGDETQS